MFEVFQRHDYCNRHRCHSAGIIICFRCIFQCNYIRRRKRRKKMNSVVDWSQSHTVALCLPNARNKLIVLLNGYLNVLDTNGPVNNNMYWYTMKMLSIRTSRDYTPSVNAINFHSLSVLCVYGIHCACHAVECGYFCTIYIDNDQTDQSWTNTQHGWAGEYIFVNYLQRLFAAMIFKCAELKMLTS